MKSLMAKIIDFPVPEPLSPIDKQTLELERQAKAIEEQRRLIETILETK